MKRVVLLVLAAAGVGFAGWYAVRLASSTSTASVAALLPKDTVFLLHLPDINRTRDQWHEADIYKLYQEPEVQEFLRKPLSRVPQSGLASQALQATEQLDAKDIFLALTSVNQIAPKYVAGFRFRGTEADAERVIGGWRSQLTEKNPNAQHQTVSYQGHRIEVIAVGSLIFASAYDGHWFFVADDQEELKRVLDRADHRIQDRHTTLDGDENYLAATAHMPLSYAALFYLQPRTFVEQLQSLRKAMGSTPSPGERTMLEKIQSVCGTTRFENGKIHDVLFVGTAKAEDDQSLTRLSLSLATKDTIIYLAAILNIGDKIDALGQAPGISGRIQKLFQTFAASHVTADDWKAAFGPELASLVDWPEAARCSVLATLRVKDVVKASKIVEAMMHIDEDSFWARTEREGVRYFSMQSPASLIAIAPTIALSDQIMIVGLDAKAVEAAIQRSRNSSSELATSQGYKTAARLVPPPTNFFAYVDTALLYRRLDTTVRPFFLMAVAFLPNMNEYFDLDRFPKSDVITRHLSPIVSSQRYESDGYVTESAGPVTLNQATIGLVVSGLAIANDEKMGGVIGLGLPALPSPIPHGTP